MKWEDVQTAAQEAIMAVRVKRLVDALRFYGDAKNHTKEDGEYDLTPVEMDEGGRAREVLREMGLL